MEAQVYSLKDAATQGGCGLTPNLWFLIFGHLDVVSLLRSAEVCRLWQSWSRNDQSWVKHVASKFFLLKFLKIFLLKSDSGIIRICPALHDKFDRVRQVDGANIQITTGKQVEKEPAKKRRRRGKFPKNRSTRPYERMKGVWNVFANRLLSKHRSQDKFFGCFVMSCIFKGFLENFQISSSIEFVLVNKKIEDASDVINIRIDTLNPRLVEISTVYSVHEDVFRRNYSVNSLDWTRIRSIVNGETEPGFAVVQDSSALHWTVNMFQRLMDVYHQTLA